MYLRLLNYYQDIRHILSETFDVARQACDRLRSRYSAHVPCRTVEPLQSHWKILNERLIITTLHTALTDITRIERQLRIFQFPGIQVVKRLQSWKKIRKDFFRHSRKLHTVFFDDFCGLAICYYFAGLAIREILRAPRRPIFILTNFDAFSILLPGEPLAHCVHICLSEVARSVHGKWMTPSQWLKHQAHCWKSRCNLRYKWFIPSHLDLILHAPTATRHRLKVHRAMMAISLFYSSR